MIETSAKMVAATIAAVAVTADSKQLTDRMLKLELKFVPSATRVIVCLLIAIQCTYLTHAIHHGREPRQVRSTAAYAPPQQENDAWLATSYAQPPPIEHNNDLVDDPSQSDRVATRFQEPTDDGGGGSGQPTSSWSSSSSSSFYPSDNSEHYHGGGRTELPAGERDNSDGLDEGEGEQPIDGNLQDRTYLSIEFVDEVCKRDRGSQRSEPLNSTYLKYCNRYQLDNLLSSEVLNTIMHHERNVCRRILNEFIQLDELINQFDRLFKKLLIRYNCHNGYSVKWSCEDCKKAYKDWLCATHLPFYTNGEQIKPCISFCERVEQRCPYLHPITKEQYGGQPVFICRDPNIPFVPTITPDIPYSDPGKCYDLCHLSDNLTELLNDSLSKYDYDKCPDRGQIAEQVRNDPYYCGPPGFPSSSSSPGSGPAQSNCTSSLDSSIANDPKLATDANDAGNPIYDNMGAATRGQKLFAHSKKLEELREVQAVYRNQPKTHHFGHHIEHAAALHAEHHYSPVNNPT